ncbi:MAG: mechanosensitive ion channel domain-containing protein [Segetibacter sp.]
MQANFNLRTVYWGNTVLDYIYVIAGILVAWLVLQLFKRWILGWIKQLTGRSKTTFDDVLITAVEKFVIPYIYFVINYTIISQLTLSARVSNILQIAMTVITIFFVVRAINHALHFSVKLYMKSRNEAEARMFQLNGILNVIKVLFWALGFLFLLDNLGYNVTTIIAGLGIGGIAIALAAQNILSDLFSYFVIFFDKPFEIGDYVVAGTESGTVEQIGIKTSRLRTLAGEELIMPNADLVKTPIHNFKRQQKRRVLFNIRIEYNTPLNMLEQIPQFIKQIISQKQNVVFDRAHLQNLSDYYINFEVVYNILSADYNLFMDTQQAIYLDIITELKSRNIQFAMPAGKVLPDKKIEQN